MAILVVADLDFQCGRFGVTWPFWMWPFCFVAVWDVIRSVGNIEFKVRARVDADAENHE